MEKEYTSLLQGFAAEYVSASPLGAGNNYFLEGEFSLCGKMYYPLTVGGTLPFRFLFQNREDTTFADGEVGWADRIGGEWEILEAFVGDGGPQGVLHTETLVPLTFGGSLQKKVAPGEVFTSDEITLTLPEGHTLCFLWRVAGRDCPYTPDKSLTPCFLLQDGAWIPSTDFPQPVLVGCRRQVKEEITFLGDSITQGLGTTPGNYAFWVARIAKALGKNHAIRNLGLGYARAQDAARDGIWLEKAKTSSTVVLCLGTNDILRSALSPKHKTPEESLVYHLLTIVKALKKAGARIFLLTVPPFDWMEEKEQVWRYVNNCLQSTLSDTVDGILTSADVWGKAAPEDGIGFYRSVSGDPHPGDAGGKAMAEAILAKFPTLWQ